MVVPNSSVNNHNFSNEKIPSNSRKVSMTIERNMEYMNRRKILANSLNEECMLIFDSAPIKLVNDEQIHRYVPNKDILYFTGFSEPNCCFVCLVDEKKNMQSFLFVEPRNKKDDIWHGSRLELGEIKIQYDLDEVYDLEESNELLKDMIINHRSNCVYFNNTNPDSPVHQIVLELYGAILYENKNLKSPNKIVHQIRCTKSSNEISLIRRACQISARAHSNLMKYAKPGLKEFQLEGMFTGEVMLNGCSRLAYDCTIGSGINGCIIHYNQNNSTLKNGDLVVVDAGGEFNGYASDISRTWPVGGIFSEKQKEIYQIVLDTQKECISMVAPGMTFDRIQRRSIDMITEGLLKLGILKGNKKELETHNIIELFYPHGIGHWIGLDVHDCLDFQTFNKAFQSGYCLTIEPGIYIGEHILDHIKDSSFIDMEKLKEYLNIAVRIEDTILVTDDGFEILSESAPREISQIEELRQKIDL